MQLNETQHLPMRRLPSAAVRELCGGISKVTLHRWMRRPELAFPKPSKIGQRSFWREVDVIAWLDAREVAA
jgi:predicted DNA-binding transcriptional regulator AlpA